MVNEPHANNICRFTQTLGCEKIGCAWREIARRVVVRDNHGFCARFQSLAKHLARIHDGRSMSCAERNEDRRGQRAPRGIKRQDEESLAFSSD